MLSGFFASPDANLPSSEGLDDTAFVPDGLLENTRSQDSDAENELVPAVFGTFGSPAVNVPLELVLNMVEDGECIIFVS